MTSKANDNIFTCPLKARNLLSFILETYPHDFNDVIYGIEPAAGDGSFVDVMKEMIPKVIAMDIEPKRSDIKKRDWLKYKPASKITLSNSVCIGNPPFSIVTPFLQKCSRVSNRIIMILPRRFYSNIPKSILPLDWKVVHSELLETNVFKTKKKIFSAFLYLKRIDGYVRPIIQIDSVKPIGFTVTSFPNTNNKKDNFDLMIWQSGGKAGHRTNIDEINNSRAYGILFHDNKKKERVLSSNIVIKKTQGTNNRSYITVNDMCQSINTI